MSEPKQGAGERPVFAVLLAGGKGTRFWPASRTTKPKQFLKIVGEASLLRLTYDRFARVLPPERILIVTSPQYAQRTRQELPELPAANLVLEPSGHDTAPAAGLAVRLAGSRSKDPIVILAPTDHFIADEQAFQAALAIGIESAESGSLVTFGIVPDWPSPAYGYIEVEPTQAGMNGARGAAGSARRAQSFYEKPTTERAAAFLATGRFYWNAGIFVWRAGVFQKTLAAVAPALAAGLANLPIGREGDAAVAAGRQGSHSASVGAPETDFPAGFVEAWEALPSISIDRALMEKAKDVCVVPLAAGWSDVGGWDAVREMLPEDAAANRAAGDVLYLGSRGCSVHRPDSTLPRRFYALVDVEGIVVVETADAVLICRAKAGERLRDVVEQLEARGRMDLL